MPIEKMHAEEVDEPVEDLVLVGAAWSREPLVRGARWCEYPSLVSKRLVLTGATFVVCCIPAGVAGSAALSPGATLWSTRDPGSGKAVAVGSDGSHVFVTGSAAGSTTGTDYSTHAYSATAGSTFWSRRYTGPGAQTDVPTAIAVRGSNTVYVTGYSDGGATTHNDFATVAYKAATGALVWARRYNGPANGDDMARAIAVSRDGSKIFVTGESAGMPSTGVDYATVAYDAATGVRLWAARYNGPVGGEDDAYSVAVGPGGGKVFVTGRSTGAAGYDYATVAYDASTGALVWAARYNGPGNGADSATSVAVAPDSTKVFVTGRSYGGSPGGTGPDDDYATIAYNAATGVPVWTKRFNGSASGDDGGRLVAVTSDGTKVVVAGMIDLNSGGGASLRWVYGTIAYKASDGMLTWKRTYGPSTSYGIQYVGSYPTALSLSGDGQRVYVTGVSYGGLPPIVGGTGYDYATVSYAVAGGAQLWARRYDAGVNGDDYANGLALKPDGSAAFVTGESPGPSPGDGHFLTIAYEG